MKGITVFLMGTVMASCLCGCQMMQKKTYLYKQGYVSYTNATVVEVKNIHEQLKFMGAATKPEKLKVCEVLLRTDMNEMMTSEREGYTECSVNTVNSRVTVYIFNDRIIGINSSPDPYLDENGGGKK